MTQFVDTIEGVKVNLAFVVRARREKNNDGTYDCLYVWRIDTTGFGSYRVVDNGVTPFNDPKPTP